MIDSLSLIMKYVFLMPLGVVTEYELNARKGRSFNAYLQITPNK